jgi:diguanylate cyclase (GGDEF)-like protein/PAS domain S-box-containing protein
MLTALETAEATTRESEEKFRTIFETSNDAIMLLDKKGFIDCNDTTLKTFACESRDEFIGRHPSEYSPPIQPDGKDSKKAADDQITNAFREGRNSFEWIHRRSTGEDFSAEVLLTPLKLEGKFVLQATVRDITERKHIEEKLRLDAAVFENTAEGIMVTDIDGVIQSVNPAFEDITGFSVEEAIGQNPRMLKSDKHDKEFYQELWSTLIDTGKWKGEIWNKRRDGELYLQETTINAINNEKGEVVQYAAIFSDITERKKTENMLRYLSSMDGLTGIANRRTFDNTLDKEWRRALRNRNHISLLIMDIDFFKKYNDKYGHPAGDRCLQRVASTIEESLKRPGDLAARYGGEEFSIILPETDAEGALYFAETMRQKIESLCIPHEKSEAAQFVTISIGVATVIPQQDITHASLIEMADKVLYKAKESGRNCIKKV